MKISVLLPISENYFDANRSIVAMLNQTHRDFEILICLNGNTKEYNRKIINKFQDFKQIKFFIKNFDNIVDALNFLIGEAKGKFIARIDADDISKNTRLEKQLEYCKKTKAEFLSTDCFVISNTDNFIYNHNTDLSKKFYTNPIVHPSIMVKTSILKEQKYRHIPFAEDYELYLRLQRLGIKFYNLNDKLLFYRLNSKNINNAKRAFFLTVSTLVVSKAFRSGLEVNERFFKFIKYNQKFSKEYKSYLKNYIFSKKINKFLYTFVYLFFSKSLLRKLVKNKLFYFYNFFLLNRKKKNYNNNFKSPFVSIIVPSYNSEKTILRTLKSLLNQTYKNFEVILVDNSRNMKTVNLVKKVFKNNKKIKTFRIEKKVLSGEARNIGARSSSKKAKFLAFCDSDDTWKENKLDHQIKFMRKKNSNLSCTNYDFYNSQTNTVTKNIFQIPFLNINFSTLAWKNVVGTSSIVVKKSLFEKVKGFPETNFFFSFEDYLLWLKLAREEEFLFLDNNLTIYRDDRKNTASKNSLSPTQQRIRILIYFILRLDLISIIKLIKGNIKIYMEHLAKKNKKTLYEEYFNML